MKSEVPRPNAGLIRTCHFQSFTATANHLWRSLGTVCAEFTHTVANHGKWGLLCREKSTPSSARESPRLFQLNQARPRALVTSPCWLCGAPPQHWPQQRLATHLRTSPKGLLLSTWAPWVWQGAPGGVPQPCSPLHVRTEEHAQEETARRQEEGNWGWLFPGWGRWPEASCAGLGSPPLHSLTGHFSRLLASFGWNCSAAIFPVAGLTRQTASLLHRPLGLFSATDLY